MDLSNNDLKVEVDIIAISELLNLGRSFFASCNLLSNHSHKVFLLPLENLHIAGSELEGTLDDISLLTSLSEFSKVLLL